MSQLLSNQKPDWAEFYMAFANTLLQYKNNREDLYRKVLDAYQVTQVELPNRHDEDEQFGIDPFTVLASITMGIHQEKRKRLMQAYKKMFSIEAPLPQNIDSMPTLLAHSFRFYNLSGLKSPEFIQNYWDLFEVALKYADSDGEEEQSNFVRLYDTVLKQGGVKWSISIGLFWLRPNTFLPLDGPTRRFLNTHGEFPQDLAALIAKNSVPYGLPYLRICERVRTFIHESGKFENIVDVAFRAWKASREQEAIPSQLPTLVNAKKRYWLYAPGRNAQKWEEFRDLGIIAIGWDAIGDVSGYTSLNQLKEDLRECFNKNTSMKNDGLTIWQFCHEIKVGDIIYAKKGRSKLLGRGIVTSEYMYSETREKYRHIRNVKWDYVGEWEHPGDAVTKTLTNITPYKEYVEKLEKIVGVEEGEDEPLVNYSPYDSKAFLDEIFFSKEKYDHIVNVLQQKSNIILQGPPGVGKTYIAKRLAYSIMGAMDESRIEMVQFHQNYSYEDFIMGFRPLENGGFKRKEGPFYKFCKRAQEDVENDYFFIIDEINRGNFSKIFGELFMLVECDKRGTDYEILLMYSDEKFSVPPNVRIIGMMNTADRSLAMIDFALRRRFAFIDIAPAFGQNKFEEQIVNLKKITGEPTASKLSNVLAVVKNLNEAILADQSLGTGFRIGHSYFCPAIDKLTPDWLDNVVNFEIIPTIREYWFDLPETVNEWVEKFSVALK